MPTLMRAEECLCIHWVVIPNFIIHGRVIVAVGSVMPLELNGRQTSDIKREERYSIPTIIK